MKEVGLIPTQLFTQVYVHNLQLVWFAHMRLSSLYTCDNSHMTIKRLGSLQFNIL